MTDDTDTQIKQALEQIAPDPEAPARITAALATRRSAPAALNWRWLLGGGVAAGAVGFALARLQGPVTGPPNDLSLALIGGML